MLSSHTYTGTQGIRAYFLRSAGVLWAKTMGFSAFKKKKISLISAKKKITFSFDKLFLEDNFHLW